jgi:predicted DNA-binding protein (MmcQ/YjbR family)
MAPRATPNGNGGGTALERLRRICMALPEASEDTFGGHTTPTFRVRGRIFAMLARDGDRERAAVWCKAPAGGQQVLVGASPERFFVPPYVGPKGWIGVRLGRGVDWAHVAGLVEDSYRLIAPKRVAAALDGRRGG